MSNGRDLDRIVEAARDHYRLVKSDIANAKDRFEHIRLTAIAQSAHNLLTDLIVFQTGIVYSHTAAAAIDQTFNETDTPLEIPEFKSPYNPDA